MGRTGEGDAGTDRGDELWAFIVLAVVLVPVLSAIVVGGIGFVVWMQQILLGPPGA